jgi:hypothetical protein
MDNLVNRARHFAIKAHGRLAHRRKYSSGPYPVHLQAVADLIASVSDTTEMLAVSCMRTQWKTPTLKSFIKEEIISRSRFISCRFWCCRVSSHCLSMLILQDILANPAQDSSR